VKTYLKEGNNAYEIRLVSQKEVIRNQYFSIVDFFKTSFSSTALSDSEEVTEDEEEVAPETEEEEVVEEEKNEDEEEVEVPAEEDTSSDEDETPEVEKNDETDAPVVSAESTQSFSTLEPLSASEIQNVIDKGFSPFQGRTLGFEYPKLWYFSYIGDGKYGFTDDATYKSAEEEITEENSRVLIVVGTLSVSCTEKATKTIDSTTYTVCAREPGLTQIIERMSESISKPE
jgi:hypothetical protein